MNSPPNIMKHITAGAAIPMATSALGDPADIRYPKYFIHRIFKITRQNNKNKRYIITIIIVVTLRCIF